MPTGRTALPRAAGIAGLVAVFAITAGVLAASASAPSRYVVGSRVGFPEWLSGPLRGLDAPALTARGLWWALLGAFVAYLVVLVAVRRRALPVRWVLAAVALAHVVVLLGPLTSTDPFGYLGYARLAVVHGIDPYTHGAGALAGDPVARWLIWHEDPSPYGPLWTLFSFAAVPLGVAGAVWAFKTVAVVASLGLVVLVARTARALGRDPVLAAAFVGLNPVSLLYAVQGAHNDALVFCGVVGALLLVLERREVAAGAVASAAVAIKAVAAPPLILLAPLVRRRGKAALGVAVVAVLVVLAGWIALGSGLLHAPSATLAQQDKISAYSVPRRIAEAFGGDVGTAHDVIGILRPLALLGLALAVWRGALDPVSGAAWAVLALVVLSTWCKPWYAIWVLPLAALTAGRGPRIAGLAFCGFLLWMKGPLG